MELPNYVTTAQTTPGIAAADSSSLTFKNIKFEINFPQTDAHVANFQPVPLTPIYPVPNNYISFISMKKGTRLIIESCIIENS